MQTRSIALCASIAALAASACASAPSPGVEYVPTAPMALGGAQVEYGVWTPPDFSPDESLPLVVFLHGGGDDPRVLDRFEVGNALTEAVSAGEFPRAVVVFPQGDDGFWMNWYDGSRRYEDWIIGGVIPEVQARYQTQACPDGCHLMGVSMGGAGAFRFALNYSAVFSSVTALSAPVLNTERMRQFATDRLFGALAPLDRIFGPPEPTSRLEREDIFVQWREPEELEVRLIFAWAEEDRTGISATNEQLEAHFDRRGISYESEVFSGGHNWVTWKPVIVRALAAQLSGEAYHAESR